MKVLYRGSSSYSGSPGPHLISEWNRSGRSRIVRDRSGRSRVLIRNRFGRSRVLIRGRGGRTCRLSGVIVRWTSVPSSTVGRDESRRKRRGFTPLPSLRVIWTHPRPCGPKREGQRRRSWVYQTQKYKPPCLYRNSRFAGLNLVTVQRRWSYETPVILQRIEETEPKE